MSSKEQNMKLNFDLGQRIKTLRENLNLSRKEMAEMADISEYFLVEIEVGRRGPSNVNLCRIAEILCTTTDYLLTGRTEDSDVTAITTMLAKIEAPLLPGAENLLKGYINSINFIKGHGRRSDGDSSE